MDTQSDNRTELLRKIKNEVINLKSSPLYEERAKNKVFPVIGEGDHYAKIMFIGEAPGKNEAQTGIRTVSPGLASAQSSIPGAI